ncbi:MULTISPECIES: hypothetical protein [Halorussus]|uniref:hypothetical protein n=1 Tax=Halorussus TaxID=1070314 RepID=UPI00209D1D15|nr:hypothetical protein [Halorussus vallis]USZ74827.1 hypothetical protein NGM07_15460 [Halorussus vallis]
MSTNWRAVERVGWTLALGGFLAVMLGSVLAPNPTRFWPAAAASLVVALPVAYWFVARHQRADDGPVAGRFTLFVMVAVAAATATISLVESATAPGTTAAAAGRTAAVVAALLVGNWVGYGGGYEAIRRRVV